MTLARLGINFLVLVSLTSCASHVATSSKISTSTPSIPTTSTLDAYPSCTITNPKVSDPTSIHGLFVNAPNLATQPDQQLILKYVLSDPTVCGANIVVPWSSIDVSTVNSQKYDFTQLDSWIKPWEDAKKLVNLIVWGVDEKTTQTSTPATPQYVLDQVNTVSCTNTTPPTPVYWQSPYVSNWENFLKALVDHINNDSSIGYLRFGIGAGGENYLENSFNSECQTKWNQYNYRSNFPTFTTSMINFEKSLNTKKQIMVGINTLDGSDQFPDSVANLAVQNGFGFGTQGLSQSAISDHSLSKPCYANWCALFAQYAGKVPLEVQTYEKSDPTGNGPVGSLVPLLSFALSLKTQVFELYPEEWLIADDPNWPGYSDYHIQYKTALQNAAQIVGET